MIDEVKLETFPSTKADALTMLYLKRQDLSKVSPEELTRKYSEVHKEIENTFRKIHTESKT